MMRLSCVTRVKSINLYEQKQWLAAFFHTITQIAGWLPLDGVERVKEGAGVGLRAHNAISKCVANVR